MKCKLSDLRKKEVISAVDGARIGYVDDIIVETKTACIVAFVIFGRNFLFGIFGKGEDYIIPWEKIDLCRFRDNAFLDACVKLAERHHAAVGIVLVNILIDLKLHREHFYADLINLLLSQIT